MTQKRSRTPDHAATNPKRQKENALWYMNNEPSLVESFQALLTANIAYIPTYKDILRNITSNDEKNQIKQIIDESDAKPSFLNKLQSLLDTIQLKENTDDTDLADLLQNVGFGKGGTKRKILRGKLKFGAKKTTTRNRNRN